MKDSQAASTEPTVTSSRGGRGRGGADGPRGSRGRATERGRGAGRGTRGGAATNGGRIDKGVADSGHEIPTSTAALDSSWDTPTIASDHAGSAGDQPNHGGTTSPDASWEMVTPVDNIPPPAEAQKASSKPDGTRSWATLFAKPVLAAARPKAALVPPVQEPVAEPPMAAEIEQEPIDDPGLPPPVPLEEPTMDRPATPGSPGLPSSEPATNITPSKDELTETNLEQVLDTSHPPPTATAASTVATTVDPRSAAGSTTPLHASQIHQTGLRPGLGGFATSAYKATSGSGRSASFQRRVMEQQEAVVMPGNHAVDRAAVQFGSMGLNGASEDLDVDDEREEAETRTQPPQHSPVAPRAALPPLPQPPAAESLPTPRQAPGLPPAGPQPIGQQAIPSTQPEQSLPAPSAQGSYPYHQFSNRYAPPASQQDITSPAQKAYEPFGQQVQQAATQQHQYDIYGSQTQTQAPSQPQASQPNVGTFSSAAAGYASYYTSDNQRNAFQNYYENYGQQSQPSQPDSSTPQQRVGSGFGNNLTEQPSHAASQGQQPQGRYGSTAEAQNSGHSTPNPALGQQALGPGQQSHQLPQQQPQAQPAGQHGGYPYAGHPSYYNSPYYNYMNQVSHQHSYGRDRPMFDDVRRYDDHYLTHNHQFGYGGSQGGYGAGPYAGAGGKQGMNFQPHQGYGMSPQTTYDQHSASPANVGGYGQQSHSAPTRDSTSTSLGGYGRTGSAQPAESQQSHAGSIGAFGGVSDVFSRSQAAYSGQNQGLAQQGGGQQSGGEEATRAYGDVAKIAGGPSPAPGPAGGRPGSATNIMQGQTGLPSSQGPSQHGYNSYQSQLNPQMHGQQASQYGAGLAGLGGHHQTGGQNHQASGYNGGYGGAFGGNYYGNNNNRGGWGGNYGH